MKKMEIIIDNRNEFPLLHHVEVPEIIRDIYCGNLEFVLNPEQLDRPLVYVNFVMDKNGIFNLKEDPGGGAISQGNRADAIGMALLRSYADAVMVGASTLNTEPSHKWHTDFIFDVFPQMKENDDLRVIFNDWRKSLRKPKYPPTFFMTNSGEINLEAPVFTDRDIQTYIVTGQRGKQKLIGQIPGEKILTFGNGENLDNFEMLRSLRKEQGIQFLLHEGGRTAIDSLTKLGLVDQFFLTKINKDVKRNLMSDNVQYLFETPDHQIPSSAKIITARTDARKEATLYNLDFRGAHMR